MALAAFSTEVGMVVSQAIARADIQDYVGNIRLEINIFGVFP